MYAQMMQFLPYIILAACIACCICSFIVAKNGTDPKDYTPKFLHPLVDLSAFPIKLIKKIPGI